MSDDLAVLASEAYFYGYPLVADVDEVIRFTRTGMGSVPAAPFNQFSHARTLAWPANLQAVLGHQLPLAPQARIGRVRGITGDEVVLGAVPDHVPVGRGDDRIVQRPDEPPLHITKIGLVGVIKIRHFAQCSQLTTMPSSKPFRLMASRHHLTRVK